MYRPKRISRRAVITLNAPPIRAFPLFGPWEEKKWARGWNPTIIYFEKTIPEENMIFRTPPNNSQEDDFIWVLTKYAKRDHRIVYTVSTPSRIWVISIACSPIADGRKTKAEISYSYTGLTAAGHERNRRSLKNMFRRNLKDWEKALNFYLETGKTLKE